MCVCLCCVEHINVPYHELPTPAARNSGLREPFLLPLSTSTNTPSFSTGSFGELIRRLKRRIITFFQWFVYRYFYSDTLVSGQATVRVEPKTFFANERTLLQWLNTAVLLSTISITLLNFGSPSGRRAGLIMAPVALFFIAYAYCVRFLSHREKQSWRGIIVCSCLFTGLFTAQLQSGAKKTN